MCIFRVYFFPNVCLQRWQASPLRPVQRLNARLPMTTELGNLSQCHGHDHDHTEPQNKDILGHGFALSYDNCSGVWPELKWSSCGTLEQLLLHCMQCCHSGVVLGVWGTLATVSDGGYAAVAWLTWPAGEGFSTRPPVRMHGTTGTNAHACCPFSSTSSSTSWPRPASRRTLSGPPKHPQPQNILSPTLVFKIRGEEKFRGKWPKKRKMAILVAQIVSMIGLGLVTWLVSLSFSEPNLYHISISSPFLTNPVTKLFSVGHLCEETPIPQTYCVSLVDKNTNLNPNPIWGAKKAPPTNMHKIYPKKMSNIVNFSDFSYI